ncbi:MULTISPECIES: outer membrane protein [unclassified Bradyrhizobium]|uniref:outer membrane protein n=1 Tax=unclassified Bradyrhizobium TaxID=2631580 RepID=UPI001BA5C1C0|nr:MULTISPECIES: outer membrane beta-barrel protein [unclassified Bradyrhizobium]MBR1229187.1 porin family protein [Bradyrhizobium sp. AUGA SZCCT0176]MBR1301779.1 porin family protein [Bradyrhizobium sp. AUGA SZCCT0042]
MRTSTLKAIAVSTFAVVAATSVASAADMAPRYTKAPAPVVEVWNWTGFYIGGNAGYSWGRGSSDVSYYNTVTGLQIAPPAGSITGASYDMNGAIAGGQVGYNWQSNNWVFGLEADAQWSDEKGSAAYRCAGTLAGGVCLPGLTFLPAGATGTNLALGTHLEWFGTVRGRVGILATPKVLFYGTGGLAYGSLKTTGTLTGLTPAGVALIATGSNSDVRLGWTVGVGVEGKITNNWSAKLEYLYMDFDSFRAASFTLAPASAIRADVDTRFHDHVLRVGLNYTFGGPVVAKY